jgi:hypothetical protein
MFILIIKLGNICKAREEKVMRSKSMQQPNLIYASLPWALLSLISMRLKVLRKA